MSDLVSDKYKRGVELQEVTPELKEPPMYRVVLYNDDFTPMDFVIEVLKEFFSMTNARATQVMLEVHYRGKGVCGIYSRDVAETKVAQINNYARFKQYPLLCGMEVA